MALHDGDVGDVAGLGHHEANHHEHGVQALLAQRVRHGGARLRDRDRRLRVLRDRDHLLLRRRRSRRRRSGGDGRREHHFRGRCRCRGLPSFVGSEHALVLRWIAFLELSLRDFLRRIERLRRPRSGVHLDVRRHEDLGRLRRRRRRVHLGSLRHLRELHVEDVLLDVRLPRGSARDRGHAERADDDRRRHVRERHALGARRVTEATLGKGFERHDGGRLRTSMADNLKSSRDGAGATS
jgi:hypothetical protein